MIGRKTSYSATSLVLVLLALPAGFGGADATVPPWNASWSNGHVSYWQTDAGMPSNSFLSVTSDPSGPVVYAGTGYSGLIGLNLSSLQIQRWNQSNGLRSDKVQSLEFHASSSRIFVGTESGIQAVNIRTGGITPVCGGFSSSTWDLHSPAGSSKLYAGTIRGLVVCDLSTDAYFVVNSTNGLPTDNVPSVFADAARGRVYVGSYPGLSVYFEANGTVLNLGTGEGLLGPYVKAVEADPSAEKVFIGTAGEPGQFSGGLSVLDAATFTFVNYGPQQGLSYPDYPRIEAVAYDVASRAVYVAVRPGVPTSPSFPIHTIIDILHLENQTVSHITLSDGLPGGIIWDLTYEPMNGLVLMAADESFGELTGWSGGGVVVLDPSAPKLSDQTLAFAERELPISIIASAIDIDGLASVSATHVSVDGTQGSVALSQDAGGVFVGTIPAQNREGEVLYRIEARDVLGHVAWLPSFQDWKALLVQDTTPPRILAVSPTGDSVPNEASILVTFSEEMDKQFVNSSFSIFPDVQVSEVSFDGISLTIRLAGLSYETQYAVVIWDVLTDIYGNVLDGDNDGSPGGSFTWNFVTEKRPTPPVISVFYPTDVRIGEAIDVQVVLEDEDGIAWSNISYRDVAGIVHNATMIPLSSAPGKEVWGVRIPSQSAPGTVLFHVLAQDKLGAVSSYPPQGELSVRVRETTPPPSPDGDTVLWSFVAIGLVTVVPLLLFVLWKRRKRRPDNARGSETR